MGTVAGRVRVPYRAMVLGVAVVMAMAGLAMWLDSEVRSLGARTPDAAVDAAVAHLKANAEAQRVDVVSAAGWDDCAVVTLRAPEQDLTVSLAMVNEAGRWRVGRQTGPEVGFDTDDVLGSREACLSIARSTGPQPAEEDEGRADPQPGGT
ncbi:MAG: hypothetical protein HY830_13050 [Actinobacteria bacterium]|nr:hypothetical protein [Actinomycetota bacterium]